MWFGGRSLPGAEGVAVRRRSVNRGALAAFVIVLALGGALFVSATRAAAAAGEHSLTIYTVASAVQYINNADDEARGMTNNPFSGTTNRLRPHLAWKGNGPFAGDVVIYSFKLYANSHLKNSVGLASYTC